MRIILFEQINRAGGKMASFLVFLALILLGMIRAMEDSSP